MGYTLRVAGDVSLLFFLGIDARCNLSDMDDVVRGIDASVPHPARRYNYWLGGKDNFAADRESGDEFARRFPGVRVGARANRAFLPPTSRRTCATRPRSCDRPPTRWISTSPSA
jgi:hypothetical protein